MFPWITAFLLSALAPALIAAGLFASLKILPLAFGIALGHAIVPGVPVALWFRAKQWKRPGSALLGGVFIGAIPVGLFAWPINTVTTSASVGGVTTIIGGVPTLAGWLNYLQLMGMFGGFGAAGGLVFWLTLRFSGVLTVDPAGPGLRQRRLGMWLAGVAIVASVTVFALPSIIMDRSCHNMFRDGRRSASPKASIDLDIVSGDRSKLAALLDQFAISHGLSLRNSSESRPEVAILSFSACTEQGVVINVHEQNWTAPAYAAPRGDRGVAIGFFDLHDGAGWQPLATELVAVLDAQWQGKVRIPRRCWQARSRSGRADSADGLIGPQIGRSAALEPAMLAQRKSLPSRMTAGSVSARRKFCGRTRTQRLLKLFEGSGGQTPEPIT